MRVETLDHKHPRRSRITCNGALKMSHKIFFSPCRTYGRCHNLPGRHLNIGHQRLGPMPNVCTFHTFDQAPLQRRCRMRPFTGLHTGCLIRAHHMYSMCMQLLGVAIPLAYRVDICITWLRIRSPVMSEPIS